MAPKGGDEKDAKIMRLEAENAKLKYRVTHLSRNLREKLENKELDVL